MAIFRTSSLFFTLFAIAAVGAMFTSCVGTRETASHPDPAANFAGYRTFAVLPAREPLNPHATPEVLRAIDATVREVFGERGLRVADVASADLLVLVHGGPREIVEPSDAGFNYGRFRTWGYGGGNYELSAPRKGMVLVDVFDARTRALVWRGTAGLPVDAQPLHASIRAVTSRFPN